MKKNMKILAAAMLLILMLVSFIGCGGDEKIYWEGNVNEEFADDKVIVVISKDYTSKKFTLGDFDMINAVELEWLSELSSKAYENKGGRWPENFRQIYAVTIGDKGKQNVIDAIRELEKLSFVVSATPNYFHSIAEE